MYEHTITIHLIFLSLTYLLFFNLYNVRNCKLFSVLYTSCIDKIELLITEWGSYPFYPLQCEELHYFLRTFYVQTLYPSQWYTVAEGQIDKYLCIRLWVPSKIRRKKNNNRMSKYEQFLELILQNIDSDNDLGEEVSEQEGHLIQFS